MIKPLDSAAALDLARADLIKKHARIGKRVIVCGGPGCLAAGSRTIATSLRDKAHAKGLKLDVELEVKLCGCHGLCEQGPLITIEPAGLFYAKVKDSDLDGIIDASLSANEVVDKKLYRPRVKLDTPSPGKKSKPGKAITRYPDFDFYRHQKRLALRHCGQVDPESLEDALRVGTYASLAKVLSSHSADQVIQIVADSGLRGRGGAGFSAGRKWKGCVDAAKKRESAGETDVPRYVLCNGDEGDPGAFMDRAIMEGDPHSVIEGMIIGGYAIGARVGYLYVREEYPLAVERLGRALHEAREAGLLGDNILGSGYSLDLHISRGGGAFVCGESSALMQSIAGFVGEPRAKYTRSVARGLHDQPTVLNNVETWVCIGWIIENGAAAFAEIGPPKSPGTKAFSLSGSVRHTGLIEVPMGVSLRHIIDDIGGGVLDDRPFKAVQTGGPSGGCLPSSCLDLKVDFDSLTAAGAMMGSGGMIVMDDLVCMVDVARYFTKFLTEESCGKCVPCREGLTQLLAILDRITRGEGALEDLDRIEGLAFVLEASLCALGTSAHNPVMSTLQYFRDEYIEHIEKGRCRAGVCKALTRFEINEACTGCLVCKRDCPVDAITGEKQKMHLINPELCTQCGVCIRVCKYDAIEVK